VFIASRRGLTLIELMVVMAIVLAVALVTIPAIGRWLGGDVRAAGRKLGSVLQTAYDEAALQNVPMRVAYNLDRHAYWVEASYGTVQLFENQSAREDWTDLEEIREEEIEEARERDEQAKDRLRTQQQDKVGDQDSPLAGLMAMMGVSLGTGALEPAPRVNEFVPLEDEVFKIRQLPPNVVFKGIWTPQWDDVVEPQDEIPEDEEEELIVYTHIFPEGYMEDSVIYLMDTSESILSLIVEPLTGRVRAEIGEADPPDREDRRVD
jgi:prepilin-type N-terminal cleavage/methylation domain-containing protein